MLTFVGTATRANTVQFGNQSGPEVVALEGGGFVVAWTDQQLNTTNARNVLFQRYDANGVAVGGNTMAASINGASEVLTDLVALPGGGFAVAWLSSGVSNILGYILGSAVQVPVARVFAANGTGVSGDVVLFSNNTAVNAVNGVELVANAGGFRAIFTTPETSPATLRVTDVSLAGAFVASTSLGAMTNSGLGSVSAVVEAIAGPGANNQLVMVSANNSNVRGSILTGTGGPASAIGVNGAFDIIDFGTGLYAAVSSAQNPLLSGDTVNVGEMFQYPNLVGGVPANDLALLNIGGNVYLQAYTTNQGVFVRTLDAVSGIVLDTSTIETGYLAQDIEVTRLANGRVAVAWSRTDILGTELYTRLLDWDGTPNFVGTVVSEVLTGSAAADSVSGLDGNDTINATTGADTLDGGAGNDLVRYVNALAAITVDLAVPANNAGAAAGQILLSIEAVEGSAFNDSIAGGTGAETLNGGAGNDVLRGNGGDDVLVASSGADTLDGGAGNDIARFLAAASAVVIDLAQPANNAGAALGQVLIGIETVEGSAFDDAITGAGGAELLLGGGGNDTLAASLGADTLDGGAGIDRLSYALAAGPVTLDMLRPTNTTGAAAGHVALSIEVVEGSAFGDRITGTNGAEMLIGNAGDDLLRSRAGADTLDGGLGNDTLDASGSPGTSLSGGVGDDRMVGGNGGDVLVGGIGNDNAFGAGGGDTIEGGVGDDQLDGGADSDMIDGGEGDDRLHGRDGNDTLFGNLGADILTGYAGSDYIDGEEADDTAYGGAGADTLFGGDGDDVLAGGDDNDVIDTGNGLAEIVTGGAGDDDITAGAGNDRLFGDAGDDEVDGGAGHDFIRGGSGADLLLGGAGNDTIQGEDGADTLDGGAGDDLFYDFVNFVGDFGGEIHGGGGFDTVNFNIRDVSAGILLYLDAFFVQSGAAERTRLAEVEAAVGTALGDTLRGAASDNRLQGLAGDDDLAGLAGNDTLEGGLGADTLDGGEGADLLLGSIGSDVMFGGNGNDIFRLDSSLEGVDVIADFASGDRIQILRARFANVSNVVATADAANAISSSTPRLFFDNAGDDAGALYFDALASDTAGRVLIAQVYTQAQAGGAIPYTALVSADFLFV